MSEATKTAADVKTRYVAGLSFDQYRTIGRGKQDGKILVVNASILKKGTALEMRQALVEEDEDSSKTNEACVLGNTVHHSVLEPECLDKGQFDKHYFWSPTTGLNTKAAIRAKRMDCNKGKTMTSETIFDNAKRMRESIMNHDFASSLLKDGHHRELTGIVGDKDNGIVRKIRIDLCTGYGEAGQQWSPWMADIKTVRADRFSTTAFASECRRNGYGIQFPYYMDTDEMILGKRRRHFYVIAVQNSPPWMCRVFEVTEESLEVGREMYQERLAMLIQANETQNWEGFEHESPPPPLDIYKQFV